MVTLRRVRGAGSRIDDRGSVVVETALVLPLLAALLFGMIDFGFVFADSSAVQQGSREAVRAAAVHNYGADTSCPIIGASPGPETAALICFTKDSIGLEGADTRVKLLLGPAGDIKGEPVTICVQYPRGSRTGVFGFLLDGKTVTSEVTMRLEGDGPLTSAEESALDASGWTSCSP